MKWILLIFLAFTSTNPKEIAKINRLKKEAEQAYLNGNYNLAAAKYIELIDSMNVDEEEIKLNLGHALYRLGDNESAENLYQKLANSQDRKLKSIALNQLGILNKDRQKPEEALNLLKGALKADPTNEEARYNYEVVKKLMKEQQQKQQDQDQQDQENQDNNEDQENKDQEEQNGQDKDQEQQNQQNQEQQENQEEVEQEKSEQQKQQEQQNGQEEGSEEDQKSQEQMTKEKLEEMGLSEEKARMLLEAMRQNEIKYLQYQKRKSSKRPPSGKPDW